MDSSLAEQQRILASDWGGGRSPFGTSWSKFMMWVFIISDALTFAAFLIAYGFMRSISPRWPEQTEVFSMVLITFMTFVLISSSAVMAMAVGAARAANPKLAVLFLVLTIVGGAIFMGCQAYEWSHFIGEGATLTNNPWDKAVPQFTSSFFVITGFHGFHVFSGVIINSIMVIMTQKDVFAKRGHYLMIEKAGLYWHFVDLVWVFVFLVFYLL